MNYSNASAPVSATVSAGLDRRLAPWVPLLLLALMAILIFAARYHTRDEPLERDMPTYAVVANEMRHGRALYSDIFDQKPPAIYATYVVAEDLAGYNRRMVFFLGVFVALVALVGAYWAGTNLGGKPLYGLWSAGLWTLLCSDLQLQANQPNTEAFMNASVFWALALLFRPQDRRAGVVSVPCALGVGVLLAWATLYKPVTVANAGCLLGAYWLFPPGGVALRRLTFGRVLAAAAVIVAAWGAVVLFFTLEGHFHAFYDAMVVYNRFYAGSLSANFRIGLHPSHILPRLLFFCLPLACLSLAGFAVGLRGRFRQTWIILVAFAFGTFVSILLPGQFFHHYYQLWLPLLCVAPALALATLAEAPMLNRQPWLPPVLGVLAALVVLAHEAPLYRLTPQDWSFRKYGTEFIAADRTSDAITRLLRPGESFYDANVDPEIYLKTGLRPPSGIFYSEPLVAGPFIEPFTRRVVRDLTAARPELVVSLDHVSEARDARRNPVVWAWIQANYRPLKIAGTFSPFMLWARRGGRLDAQAALSGR